MISLNRIERNVFSRQLFLDKVCHIDRGMNNIVLGILPEIMSPIVSRPKEQLGLDSGFDELEHAPDCVLREIAILSTPLFGLSIGLSWVSVFVSATHL